MDKILRYPENLLTSVFSVYFCDVGHETRDCETRDDWMSRVPRPEVTRQNIVEAL